MGRAHDQLGLARLGYRQRRRRRRARRDAAAPRGSRRAVWRCPIRPASQRRGVPAAVVDDRGEGRAAQQDHAGDQQEDREDVGAGRGDQVAGRRSTRRRRAGRPAAPSRPPTRTRLGVRPGPKTPAANASAAPAAGRSCRCAAAASPEPRSSVAREDPRAAEHERDRDEVGELADQQLEAAEDPMAERTAGPEPVGDAAEEDPDGDQREREHINLVRLEVANAAQQRPFELRDAICDFRFLVEPCVLAVGADRAPSGHTTCKGCAR